jgi:hypothetical protein
MPKEHPRIFLRVFPLNSYIPPSWKEPSVPLSYTHATFFFHDNFQTADACESKSHLFYKRNRLHIPHKGRVLKSLPKKLHQGWAVLGFGGWGTSLNTREYPQSLERLTD